MKKLFVFLAILSITAISVKAEIFNINGRLILRAKRAINSVDKTLFTGEGKKPNFSKKGKVVRLSGSYNSDSDDETVDLVQTNPKSGLGYYTYTISIPSIVFTANSAVSVGKKKLRLKQNSVASTLNFDGPTRSPESNVSVTKTFKTRRTAVRTRNRTRVTGNFGNGKARGRFALTIKKL